MIKSFNDKGLRLFWETGKTHKLPIQNARRVGTVLDLLNSATKAADMDIPGLNWHDLRPYRPTTYTVWVSGNYRITFTFSNGDAYDVDIEDYH